MPIRSLVAEDQALYIAMAKEFYASEAVLHPVKEAYFHRTFAEMMRSTEYVEGFILENDQGEAGGYAIASKTFSQEAGGMVAWVEELYLRPRFQGQGLGQAFFAFFQQLHPEIVRYRLEVEESNVRAIALYERLGFSPIAYYQMGKDVPQA